MEYPDHINMLTADAVQLLKEMIAVPSPSFEEDAVCSHICQWLDSHGIEHKRTGNNIIAEHIVDHTRPTLMMCAHIDTVSPSPEYSFDPYRPENCPEDMVQGLGSNDDGASVVSMIATYRYLCSSDSGSIEVKNRATPLAAGGGARDEVVGGVVFNPNATAAPDTHINLILVLTCEEERSGKNGMTGLWSELKDKVDYAIVGEPTGMKAATAERGLLVIDATAHGIAGHAARNEGKNALYIALEDIEKLRKHEFSRISPRMGKVNLNVTQINAGSAHNVIPDRCDFVIDIRPTEQYTNEEILKELQDICESELKPRNLANRSSATFENSPLQKTAERLGIETFSSPTTSDWMRITCDAVKMGPGESSRSHKKDEFVYVEEIRNGIQTYIDFINNYEHTLE
jgi:acetylornithine deacetylase